MNYCGIYKITQKSTGKVYIGQSLNVTKRIEQHLNDSTDDWHKIMQNNLKDWSIEFIETCEPDELNNREQYWIHYYDSYNKGFNRTYKKQLNLTDIQIMAIDETFYKVDLERISKAIMSNSCQTTLSKLLFIHHNIDCDYCKFWFKYYKDDIAIIQLMPYKNKQCKKEDTIYFCLDLNRTADNNLVKDVLNCYAIERLYNFSDNLNSSNSIPSNRIYLIRNCGGYKCKSFFFQKEHNYIEFGQWYIDI